MAPEPSTVAKRISLTRLVFLLSAAATVLAVVVVLAVSGQVRKKSINDLARDEARQTSALVFEALYSAMRKGWSKEDIGGEIDRLRHTLPDLGIRVVRGRPVIEQFGELDDDRAVAAADPMLAGVLDSGQEALEVKDTSIRYLYPLVVREECRTCHTAANVGDVNGVIDIVYPVHALKVSLDYVLHTVLAWFFAILVLFSAALYFKLKYFVARPIADLVGLMHEMTMHPDLTRRLKSKVKWISEVDDLSNHFNRLLRTVEEYHAKLEEVSVKDPLTRLYNRRKFSEFLKGEIDRAARHRHSFCLVQIDLDSFKNVNDTFGHPVGDMVLRELASVLEGALRRTDVLARTGADEFAVLLTETTREEGERVAEKLRQSIADAQLGLSLGGVRITASLGLVSYPDDGEDHQRLAIAADMATYKAKRGGKNQVAVLGRDDDTTVAVFSQGEMVRTALAEGRLVPWFQPLVDVATGRVRAYEVLARVMDGDDAVCAGDFIEAAEELGLAAEIDEAVFSRTLEIAKSGAFGDAKLFFNLSAKSLADRERMAALPDRLAKAGIDPARVVLEITEREALPRFGDVVVLVNELRALGLQFALDDFGAGFSSFMYLKYITVDTVKIEGSFIRHMVADERDRIMVHHIHAMARDFGLNTVAEFVEDEETMDMLRQMGIDLAQGFHVGRPMAMPVLVPVDKA
ncbi:MAG: putative bifunctional diguanylate cyclase/phosphodiesterase [Actinomycetota bacterium]